MQQHPCPSLTQWTPQSDMLCTLSHIRPPMSQLTGLGPAMQRGGPYTQVFRVGERLGADVERGPETGCECLEWARDWV